MKPKPHGRFGSRYGKRIRKAVLEADRKAKARYECPFCSRISVRRVAAGIWQCGKCGKKMASGAYEFKAA
ncbi:MAG: 50S ribosomal protein L37ae [Candidatus Aenigmatarchaeota archaeon]